MKKGWDRYAAEKRYIKKGYFRKYRNGNPVWKNSETGSSDCIQHSRKEKEVETAIQTYGKVVLMTEEVLSNEPLSADEAVALIIYKQALIDSQDKIIKERKKDESKIRLREPIQSSGEISSQVGSGKSRSRRSSSGNEKIRRKKDGKDGRSREKES